MPKKKILFVEDETDFLRAVRMRLEANNYKVIEATDGLMALKLARTRSPDLIILDIVLPKMDGLEVARQLKSDKKHKKIPIVMLTASAQLRDDEKALTVGVDVYLTKPCKPEDMLSTIERLLSK